MDTNRKIARWLWINLAALAVFSLYSGMANWSIIIGENLMKWDIWDAEYPLQMLMSDALANHTIPLWNPLMRFGTPHYAMAGTPVWYPITMLLALFGYKPNTIAISYAMHIVIGGFGMFLLAKQELSLRKQNKFGSSEILTALVAGLLYCGSGLFTSNAEHIMIIISAAWFPYVFYCTRRYLEEKKLIYGMLAGACAAMILLGGYPEMFYNLFLLLAFYVFFLYYQKEYSVIHNVLLFIKKYCTISVCTIMGSAVMLIPFLMNLNTITRTSGLGQTPETKPLMTLLSFFLPGTASYLPTGEISMSNFYIGLLPVLLIPLVFRTGSKAKKTYLFLSLWSFMMCWGRTSFLHNILYRFLPMYSSFRFPTLNRALMAIFLILIVTPEMNELMEGRAARQTIVWNRRLAAIIWACALVGTFLCSFFPEMFEANTTVLMKFVDASFMAGLLLVLWMFVFSRVRDKRTGRRTIQGMIAGTVVLELLLYSSVEAPITVTSYSATDYARDLTVRNAIDNEFNANLNYDRGINFAGHKRSTSGIKKSKEILFNKTFDEEGYVSFRLQSVDSFLHTYNRSIIEQNPVVYFTNNVVTDQKTTYAAWVDSPAVPPEQIFAEKALNVDEKEIVEFKTEKLSVQELALQKSGNELILEGVNGLTEPTGRVRLYFEQKSSDVVPMEVTFVLEDGSEQTISDNYRWRVEDGTPYIDICAPVVGGIYQSLRIKFNGVWPTTAALVVLDRMSEDGYVDVYDFGFNSIGMNVTAPTEGYVTLLQAKHDGWTAYVDGVKQEITTIDECFMGLYVEPGEHTIVMRFRPKEFFVGAFVSAMYFVALGIMMIQYGLKKRKTKVAEV